MTRNRTSDLQVDKVERALEKMIVTLELAPADVLSVAELMKLLECGRTPLRLALERLRERGLVMSVPNRGFIIAPVSLDEFADLWEFSNPIEALSARLAARRITDEQLARLEEIVAQAEKIATEGDHQTLIEIDSEFHLQVAHASGNQYVVQTMNRVTNLQQRFSYIAARRGRDPVKSWESWLTEMRRVLAALKNRDPDEAELRMREHDEEARKRTKAFL